MKTINKQTKLLIALFLCFCYLLVGCKKEVIVNDLGKSFKYNPQEIAPGIELGAIYTTNNFASFTDIAYFDNAWYVTFRTGTQHIGGLNGEIKILKSDDAITWKVEYIIQDDSLDLRDPKFIVDTPNNKLYINYFGAINNPQAANYRLHNFIVAFSIANGYGNPREINVDTSAETFAFWRYTYHKGKTYSASFRVPLLGGYTTDDICLFNNNSDYETYASLGKLKLGSSPNEATIRFDANDNMYFLIRRETAHVALGSSTPSDYTNVKWVDDPLSTRLSSPNFLFYGGNRLLISGRDQDDLKFKFYSYNLTTNKVEKKFVFPSGEETGYAGMSFNPLNSSELLMSYYVINGEKSSINLVRMDLKTFLQ